MDKIKEPYRSALMRALHTFWETLAGTSPAAIVVTAVMLETIDFRKIGLSFLAWIISAVIAAGLSFVKSMAVGMPETSPDTSLTWEQFQADKGKIVVKAVEEDDSE